MSDIKIDINESPIPSSPVAPVQFEGDHVIQFRCHKGIGCFNACCKQIDITLTPYDIIRLKNRLGMSSEEFLKKHTVPFEMDKDGLPGVKMRTQDEEPVCLFMDEEAGCTVYEDRPTACRYYPVGLLSMRKQDEYVDEQKYVLVEEEHCLGHQEDQKLTIDEYRADQKVEEYDEHGRGWRQLVLKKKSTGPAVGKPSKESLQLFFMACYNHDKLREFINQSTFTNTFDLDQETLDKINSDDVELMHFGIRFLKQVLFGEQTIPMKTGVEEERIKQRRERMAERERLLQEAAQREDVYEMSKEEKD